MVGASTDCVGQAGTCWGSVPVELALLRSFAEYRVLLFGVLMVLMMIWRPRGLIRISRVGVKPRKGVAP